MRIEFHPTARRVRIITDKQHVLPDIDRKPRTMPADVNGLNTEFFKIAAEGMIDAVLTSVGQAVEAMVDGTNEVDNGTRLAGDTT